MERSAPPPLRLSNPSDHHLSAHPYLPGGHSPIGRAHRPSPADSHLYFGAQDRIASPPPSRSFYPGDVPPVSTSVQASLRARTSPLTLSPKNLSSSRDNGDQPLAAKRLALDDSSRLFYPFSLPTAHFKITSRSKFATRYNSDSKQKMIR